MIEELRTSLIPRMEALGWVKTLPSKDGDSPELRRAFPLGYFKRERGGAIHAADFQFDRHFAPKFRIQIGTMPKDGLSSELGTGQAPAADCNAGLAPDALYLSQGRYRSDWFGFWWWQPKSLDGAKRVARRALELWPEVEMYFENGQIGPHLHKRR